MTSPVLKQASVERLPNTSTFGNFFGKFSTHSRKVIEKRSFRCSSESRASALTTGNSFGRNWKAESENPRETLVQVLE